MQQQQHYDPIFAKSFSRYHRKRFGFCALFILAFTFCSSYKRPLSLIGGAVNLELSINAVEQMLIADHNSDKPGANFINDLSPYDEDASRHDQEAPSTNGSSTISLQPLGNATPTLNQTTPPPIDMNSQNYPHQQPPQSNESKKITEPLCRVLKADADYCDIVGDIRVISSSSTILVITPPSTVPYSWTIQPYPRKGITYVKNWTVTLASENDVVPKCSKTHALPAILFSTGGYTGNHFHDFADVILPLYSTSFQFKRNVRFLASDYKPWWPLKFRGILDRLTKHGIVDIDSESDVNCYSKLIAGLRFHKELIVDPSLDRNHVSMVKFRELIRETYSLVRKTVKKVRRITRPRLVIISRKKTRIMTNEGEVSRLARKLGFEVVLAEGEVSSNMTKFAQLVNSCDVMMGIHGAGLTNMVFLPDNAVLIQVVPLGAIDGFAKLDFGNPAPVMKIRYLEYKIGMRESSLIQQYPVDHPVLRDPTSFHRNGWGQLRAVYLDNQNVTIDIHRFKGTLAKALKLLRH